MILWTLAVPASLTLLSRVSDVIGLSGTIAYFVSHWRAFTHTIWGWVFDLVQGWVRLPSPSDGQKDLLTLGMLLIGTTAASFAIDSYAFTHTREVDPVEAEERENAHREIFYFCFFVVTVIFCLLSPGAALLAAMLAQPPNEDGILQLPRVFLTLASLGLVEFGTRKFWVGKSFVRAGGLLVVWLASLAIAYMQGDSPFTYGKMFPVNMTTDWSTYGLAALVGTPFAIGSAAAYGFAPKSLVRIALFAAAVFVVDRLVWITGPIGNFLHQMQG